MVVAVSTSLGVSQHEPHPHLANRTHLHQHAANRTHHHGMQGSAASKAHLPAPGGPTTSVQAKGSSLARAEAGHATHGSRQMSRALEDAGGHEMCAATAADPKASAKSAWKHMVVVNAWNEWGEQAVLEPTVQYGDAVLVHHRRAVASVEAAVRKAKAHTVGR